VTDTSQSGRAGSLVWRTVEVVEVRSESERARAIGLRIPDWPGHDPGQRVDVRLTADDGYQAERSYSIASPPEASQVELTVERIVGGEVSPYLVDELRVGDTLEVRGPIGRHFRWRANEGGPLLLVAGGSGIVPLMAMLRHRAVARLNVPARLVYSARTLDDVFYRSELVSMKGGPRCRRRRAHSDPIRTGKLDGMRASNRPRAARAPILRPLDATSYLRLRPHRFRRASGQPARRPWPRCGADLHGALRT